MKITYLILAHSAPELMERMIDLLNHPNAEFIIHVDKKEEIKPFCTSKLLGLKNISFLKKRLTIAWGGFNMVEATLSMMNKAVKKNKNGYLVLLSGHDFPVKPAGYIYDFLSSNYGSEYLEYFSMPDTRWPMNDGLDRLTYYWFVDQLGLDETRELYGLQKKEGKKRPYFRNFTPYGGSQWWALTSECAYFILRFLKYNTIYKSFYELTYIPDEMFFHSIILNSPFKENVINNNLRYIDWKKGPEYPRVFTSDDLNDILQSDRLWARKFSAEKDPVILDELERNILT